MTSNTLESVVSQRELQPPTTAEGFFAQANVLKAEGKLQEAMAYYQQAIQQDPQFAQAYHNLGNTYHLLKKPDLAFTCYQKAVQCQPSYGSAWSNLGVLFRQQKKLTEAVACYQEALRHQPAMAEAHHNLANVYVDLKQWPEATHHYQEAIALKPEYLEASLGLGGVYLEQGAYALAAQTLEDLLQRAPHFSKTYSQLGKLALLQGQLPKALSVLEKGLAQAPQAVDLQWNRAIVLLTMGNYEEGWPAYESRLQIKAHPQRVMSQPEWKGELLEGQRLLILTEQGLGDTIQFGRYLRLCKEAYPTSYVLLECPPALKRLFAQCPWVDEIVEKTQPLQEPPVAYDYYTYLLSLPKHLNTTLSRIPSVSKTFSLNPRWKVRWHREIRNQNRMNVGLVWGSKSDSPTAHLRSAHLKDFLPLVEGAPSVDFYSLQKGPAAQQAQEIPMPPHFVDLTDSIQDFADTAALIWNLDLVITVDTAVAHLAGMFQKPVWVLLPADADWRWLQNRDDSPWYPTARLFRQKQPGQWDFVIEQVQQELQRLGLMQI